MQFHEIRAKLLQLRPVIKLQKGKNVTGVLPRQKTGDFCVFGTIRRVIFCIIIQNTKFENNSQIA